MQGYIKDYRKELESDIWMMPPLYHRTWQWLKYNVNHEDAVIPMRDGSQFQIKRGQKLTSVRDIAKAIGWWEGTKEKVPNPKTISTILEWMVKTEMISIERGQGNRQYTLITLVKYEDYQEKTNQGNSKETVSKQQADINNNDKNVNNDNKKEKAIKREYADFVFLTESEHSKLTELLGEAERDSYFLKYASWISGKTEREQKKRSAYLSILNWHREDQKKPKNVIQASSYQKTKTKLQQMLEEAEGKKNGTSGHYQTGTDPFG